MHAPDQEPPERADNNKGMIYVPQKLVFYSTASPDSDAKAWRAFTFAKRATANSLDCEIVLAGAATGLVRKDARDRLKDRHLEAFEAVQAAGVPIWLSPG